ncbi:MAG: nucleotide exchange factor GrpE [Thermoleophilaceae bacterium]
MKQVVDGEDPDAAEAAETTDQGAPVTPAEVPAPDEHDAEPALDHETVDDDPVAAAEAQRDEYLALAQRAQADFDNYRKRATRDIAAAGARAKAALATELLPVLDNLERALDSAEEEEEKASLAEGVRLVHSELLGALDRSGVRAIEPAGEPFDPNVHEALSTRSENGADAGVVLDVIQKGYRLDQTVLRPARVVVAA